MLMEEKEMQGGIYVALLRGINIGGRNGISMKPLKETFERVGMGSVQTYINSGNIIFRDRGHSEAELSILLEKAILKDFGLQIKVLIRSFDDFKLVLSSLPKTWSNDQRMKSDVMFLWEEIDDSSIKRKLQIKPQIDRVKYVSGALLWSTDRENVTKSGMMKLAATRLYRQMTIRNVNTTRKLYELMREMAQGG